MEAADPRAWRVVPETYLDSEEATCTLLSADWHSDILAAALEQWRPKGVGILLPFSWQMHWYVYKEVSARGIKTAVAMPNNPAALTGMLRSISIDAVVANDIGARAFHEDLRVHGLLEQMRLWVVLSPKRSPSDFSAAKGAVVHISLP